MLNRFWTRTLGLWLGAASLAAPLAADDAKVAKRWTFPADAAAWTARISQGVEALYHAALKGKNAMPPQGGGDFNDDEIKRAVVYMANAGGAKFTAPPVVAAAASGADAAASAASAP